VVGKGHLEQAVRMNFEAFVTALENRLRRKLPGEEAQFKMAPSLRPRPDYDAPYMQSAKRSAVLVLLYPVKAVAHTVLILRPQYEGVHAGQVSFPGGRHEEADDSLEHTALREAEEEVGIEPQQVQVAGRLTQLYIPPSSFLVHPVIGYTRQRPGFTPDSQEVDRIIEVDILTLLDDAIIGQKDIPVRGGFRLDAPYFNVQGHTVWGATAMMISELRAVLQQVEPVLRKH